MADMLVAIVVLGITVFLGAFGPSIALSWARFWNWLLVRGLAADRKRRRLVDAYGWYKQIRQEARDNGHSTLETTLLLMRDWARGAPADVLWRINAGRNDPLPVFQETNPGQRMGGGHPVGGDEALEDAKLCERASFERILRGDKSGWNYFANAKFLSGEGVRELLQIVGSAEAQVALREFGPARDDEAKAE